MCQSQRREGTWLEGILAPNSARIIDASNEITAMLLDQDKSGHG